MKIKKNDQVQMLSGKDRGKAGKVSVVLPARRSLDEGGPGVGKVVVEGLNLIKRHVRARKQGQKGQIISKERPVSASSVALVCKSCGKPTRIGYRVDPDASVGAGGKNKVRVCKKCKREI
ncbi:MAG: 50S ribosomal protein L24 [Candidatus Yanofskybacteria bacterium]|nr:50S ribosomal protein L24 [Candidatus Yanofskybacteria bacterium]